MKAALLFAFVLIAGSAFGETCNHHQALEHISQETQHPLPWRADFSQENHIQGLSTPLASTGEIYVHADGAVWRTLQPLESTLVITGDGISIDEQTLASSRLMGELLYAVINGQLAVLDQHFALEACKQEAGWQVALTPKSEALAARITDLAISGTAYLEHLTVRQAGGNALKITFAAPSSIDQLPEGIRTHLDAQ